jgi:hypothetical protein
MDATTLFVNALAVGAAASFRPNAMYLPEDEKQEMTLYGQLKELIAEKYSRVEADLLDIGPASLERQQQLKGQLQQAGIEQDTEALNLARALLRACYENEPEAFAAVGLGPAEFEQHLYYDQGESA